MTIKEMLNEDVEKLKGIRLPISEVMATKVIVSVIDDMYSCLSAIREAEKNYKEESKEETEEASEN